MTFSLYAHYILDHRDLDLEGLSLSFLQVIRTHSCVSCLSLCNFEIHFLCLSCRHILNKRDWLYLFENTQESTSMTLTLHILIMISQVQMLLTHLSSLVTGISASQCVDCGSCPLVRLSLCVVWVQSRLFLYSEQTTAAACVQCSGSIACCYLRYPRTRK